MALIPTADNNNPSTPVYVVEEQGNPSTDYFVRPALAHRGGQVKCCGFADLPAPADLHGATVVFVRYVPQAWMQLVDATRPRLSGLVFFMDDDVLDMRATAGTPLHYRFKLARLAAGRRRWLRRNDAELWVSTEHLRQKYANWQPRLVLPAPLAAATELRRVFYHGTASHAAEKRWLQPVIEEVLSRDDHLAFEIVGGSGVHRLYRGLPRVSVVHQMSWQAYQAFLAAPGRHIGLAPQLDQPFNRARSYTKFFDITRGGAAGIYAPHSACAAVINDGVDGLIVDMQPESWVDAILGLARDEVLREVIVRNAATKLVALAEDAQRGYAGLLEPRAGE